MMAPQPDGATLRDHLESLARQLERQNPHAEETREARARLLGPDFPEPAEHVWKWFGELHRARSNNDRGPNSISFLDIISWALLTHQHPSAMEIDWIAALDDSFLEHAAKQAKAK